jgi:beta-N-acetylhexosaminidase
VCALEAGADLLLLDAPHMRDAEADFRQAVAAVDRAVAEGRLDEQALRASAARNAVLARSHSPFSDAACTEALEALELLGALVAERALRVTGDVTLRGQPVVIDVRRRVDHASGSLHNPLLRAFEQAGIEAVAASAHGPLPADAQPVVLTRQPLSDDTEARALWPILAARPDAIVVHGGMMAAAPQAGRLLCMHGIGAVNARAAVQLMSRP